MSAPMDAVKQSLTELEASVAGETTIVDSVIAYIDGQNAIIMENTADATSLPDLQARNTALVQANEAMKTRLAAAVPQGVPNIPPEAIGNV